MAKLELNPIPNDPQKSDAVKPPSGTSILDVVNRAIENGARIDQITALYLKLRNAKKDLDEQNKVKVRPISEALEKIENHFLAVMNEQGVDSLKNEAGTPYRSERTSITVADNAVFVDYVLTRALQALAVSDAAKAKIKEAIMESGQLALIEARASKTAVEMLLEETQELPPGLNRRVEATVNVRAS